MPKQSINERLEEVLDIAPVTTAELEEIEVQEEAPSKPTRQDIINCELAEFLQKRERELEEDYEFSRRMLRDIAEKGNESLDSIIRLAADTESPRAYEVLATMLKNVAEVTREIMTLQKTTREIGSMSDGSDKEEQQQVINNNAVFVGSTKELAEMLKQNIKSLSTAPPRNSKRKGEE